MKQDTNQDATISGEVTDLFAHRFVVTTSGGTILADIGPHGSKQIVLARGDIVALTGAMTPSEFKVEALTRGDETMIVARQKPAPDHGQNADPVIAWQTARDNGLTVVGMPRRKPKHFEVLGRDTAGGYVELHVELDGALRKSKPGDPAETKGATSGDAPSP